MYPGWRHHCCSHLEARHGKAQAREKRRGHEDDPNEFQGGCVKAICSIGCRVRHIFGMVGGGCAPAFFSLKLVLKRLWT